MRIRKLPQAEEYTFWNRLRRLWRKAVRVMACIVVFCTTYALILPAITQESPVQCGIEEHTHRDTCIGDQGELICELDAHSHSLACHADAHADLESADFWESTLASAERSSIWARDVVSIARTQLGYVESTRNYQVQEDGISLRGYSRYGAWYGDPYGDWNAMFVGFCLHYAGVEYMPLAADAKSWAEALAVPSVDLYRSRGSHVPQMGQLLFLDNTTNGLADRVAIIISVTTDDTGTPSVLETIEGDRLNRVQLQTYSMDHPAILGYGLLPQQLTAQERAAVQQVIADIDALAAMDQTGEEFSWQVARVYDTYANLTVAQKAAVTNEESLLAMEAIWSNTTYIAENHGIVSAAPTQAESAGTRDYLELNIFDYTDSWDASAAPRNEKWLDGLFQFDPATGTYSYDSRKNHAQYDATDYDRDGDTDEFILFHQVITPDFTLYPYGCFLPFHSISDLTRATQVGAFNYPGGLARYVEGILAENPAENVKTLLEGYRENTPDWDSLSPSDLADGDLDQLYNIDWDVPASDSFCLEMKLTFLQPQNGTVGADPVEFSFSGENDLWVYVDGVLFLNLTGSRGTIDFQKGLVSCFEGGQEIRHSFSELLHRAGWTEEQQNSALTPPDSQGNRTFRDYSTHSFQLYYLTRTAGAWDLRFNFPLLKPDSLTVSKALLSQEPILGNPNYRFQVLTADGALFLGPNSETGVDSYKIMDSGGNILQNPDGTHRIFRTDDQGTFSLKAGQRAIFENVSAYSGDYFLRELTSAEDGGQHIPEYISNTPGTVFFQVESQVVEAQLGALAITRKTEGTDTVSASRLEVILDSQRLPVGTPYLLIRRDGTEIPQTVTEPGILILEPEETAIIGNILSGTAFQVQETEPQHHTVTYTGNGPLQRDGGSLQGVIRSGQQTELLITQIQEGASVQIPVTQTITNGLDDGAYESSFRLVGVTDDTGETETGEEALDKTLSFSGRQGAFAFTISYRKQDIPQLPATFYYRIIQEPDEHYLSDDRLFVAEVLVAEADDGTISASLVQIHGSDTGSADFTATQAGALTLTLTVQGEEDALAQGFDFRLHLVRRAVPLPRTYTVMITDPQGDTLLQEAEAVDGDLIFYNITHGTTVTVTGIPVSTRYTITETIEDGFLAASRTGNKLTTSFTTEGIMAPGNTAVAYINTQTYVLPETGGSGTTLYTMAGCMLMLYCAAYLLYRYHKRRREVAS